MAIVIYIHNNYCILKRRQKYQKNKLNYSTQNLLNHCHILQFLFEPEFLLAPNPETEMKKT